MGFVELCVDDMTKEQFQAFIDAGYADYENGDYQDEEEVFAELAERFGVNAGV